MITLEKITENNLSDVLQLKVADNQAHHVDAGGTAVAISFAFAWLNEGKEVSAFAIEKDGEVIGLAIYYLELIDFGEEEFHNLPFYNDKVVWFDYFIIDEKHQGNGYGRVAFAKLLQQIEEQHSETEYIMIRYSEDNEVARKLYNSAGFDELFTLEQASYATYKLRK